jgi:glucose dehydrogenase
MRRPTLIVAVLLALVGLVWLGQGTGLIGGSVMSGSSFWAVVGLALLVAAGVLVAREVRRPAK